MRIAVYFTRSFKIYLVKRVRLVHSSPEYPKGSDNMKWHEVVVLHLIYEPFASVALQQRFTWKGMYAEVTDYVTFVEIVKFISYILKLNDFLFVCLFIYPN